MDKKKHFEDLLVRLQSAKEYTINEKNIDDLRIVAETCIRIAENLGEIVFYKKIKEIDNIESLQKIILSTIEAIEKGIISALKILR